MRSHYLTEAVAAIEPLDGYRVRATFADGFTGEVDLAPLLQCGPIFEPLRDLQFFRRVTVSAYGIPEWTSEVDLSAASLRAWCEAGKFMDYEETDAWIDQHDSAPEKVA